MAELNGKIRTTERFPLYFVTGKDYLGKRFKRKEFTDFVKAINFSFAEGSVWGVGDRGWVLIKRISFK